MDGFWNNFMAAVGGFDCDLFVANGNVGVGVLYLEFAMTFPVEPTIMAMISCCLFFLFLFILLVKIMTLM